MADKLELRVISRTQATGRSPFKLKRDVDMAIMRCNTGDLGVLPGHVPCSMVLDSGILRFFEGDEESYMALRGGMAHVSNDVVTILSDSALLADDMEVEDVEADILKKEELLEKSESTADRSIYQDDLKYLKIMMDVLKSGK